MIESLRQILGRQRFEIDPRYELLTTILGILSLLIGGGLAVFMVMEETVHPTLVATFVAAGVFMVMLRSDGELNEEVDDETVTDPEHDRSPPTYTL